MSLKMANRISIPVKPRKSQNLTTEGRGRINVLVREIQFIAVTHLGNSMIQSFNVSFAYQEFVGLAESQVCLQGISAV